MNAADRIPVLDIGPTLANRPGAQQELARAVAAIFVLAMLALLKIARTLHGEFNRDDWVDALGYVALAGQVAEEDHEQEALERRAAEVVRQ